MIDVSSFGNLSNTPHHVIELTDRSTLTQAIQNNLPGIPRGMGKSYGDIALNPGGTLWNTTYLDRLIAFDENTGILTCEAGVLLGDIQALFMPKGWCLPVTPGTRWVTVGGAIANDVHGKNQIHLGSFGHHIEGLSLLRTNGEMIHCGPTLYPDWFQATVGGMGLTGLITTAQIKLKKINSQWLETCTTPFASLKRYFELSNMHSQTYEYTVAWIDCLSKHNARGIFKAARPSQCERPLPKPHKEHVFPFTPRHSWVNPLTIRAFNWLYYYRNRKESLRIEHYIPFLYPLDHIAHWNRIYGKKGFYQYQCLVPFPVAEEAIGALLATISQHHEGSFLSVLKTFGKRDSLGLMGFAKEGVTLALDFANRGEQTLSCLNELDAIVHDAGGRIYLAKDARMSKTFFEASYPNLNSFLRYRDDGISSAMSRRLIGN